jgi:hypothetical protein
MKNLWMYEASTDMVDVAALKNGNLKISLRNDKEARIEWLQLYADTYYDHKYGSDDAWMMLMEDIGSNSEYEVLNPESGDYAAIGALTSAPIIAWVVDRDDDGTLTLVEHVWWFPNYQVQDWVQELFETGFVIFSSAQEYDITPELETQWKTKAP